MYYKISYIKYLIGWDFVIKTEKQASTNQMNQRIHQVLIWLFLFGITANSFAADEQHKPFSMAISGGASKGAYEAGLNWGLLKILRDEELTPGGQGRVWELGD